MASSITIESVEFSPDGLSATGVCTVQSGQMTVNAVVTLTVGLDGRAVFDVCGSATLSGPAFTLPKNALRNAMVVDRTGLVSIAPSSLPSEPPVS